ncbi:MAG: cysteine hydrolase family protein [Sellimonas sp.]|uniref:cysteine hydrolase family protein n=1 Tax=Sellimonas sp. TaxID=2021466 RepID=UPI000B3962F3|nr:amidase [Drancourtella sp. An177]
MKELLVVVDIQNDFVTGSLGTKEAQEIVQNARKKIESYEQDNKEIVFTRDTHEENYLMTQEGRNLPVKHCIRGTEGWEIIPELQEYTKGRRIFDKPSFGSIDLASYIRDGGYDRVEFIGLCTDICVVSNALLVKAYVPEITVSADASCCAGVTPQSHDSALCTMKMCQIEINYK